MYLQLDLIKKHLNIDQEYSGDDEYLYFLAEVAEKVVEKHIDCNLDECCDSSGELEKPLVHCILLYIGDLYENRESISYSTPHSVPFSYDYLLGLYKNYGK